MQYKQKAKCEERRILKDDVDQNGPHVDGAADFLRRVAAVVGLHAHFGLLALVRIGREDERELEQAPRPYRQDDDAEHSVVSHFVILYYVLQRHGLDESNAEKVYDGTCTLYLERIEKLDDVGCSTDVD